MKNSPKEILDYLDKMMDAINEEVNQCPCEGKSGCTEGCDDIDGVFLYCQVLEEIIERSFDSTELQEKDTDMSEISRLILMTKNEFLKTVHIDIQVPEEGISAEIMTTTRKAVSALFDTIVQTLEEEEKEKAKESAFENYQKSYQDPVAGIEFDKILDLPTDFN